MIESKLKLRIPVETQHRPSALNCTRGTCPLLRSEQWPQTNVPCSDQEIIMIAISSATFRSSCWRRRKLAQWHPQSPLFVIILFHYLHFQVQRKLKIAKLKIHTACQHSKWITLKDWVKRSTDTFTPSIQTQTLTLSSQKRTLTRSNQSQIVPQTQFWKYKQLCLPRLPLDLIIVFNHVIIVLVVFWIKLSWQNACQTFSNLIVIIIRIKFVSLLHQ